MADYSVSLKTVNDCEGFIKSLHKEGNLFHFDDDLKDIGIFTAEECKNLNDRLTEIFNLMDDPFKLCVELIEQDQGIADLSKLIHLCNEQKRLDTEDDYGSDEQVNIENALYDEAQRLALKENRADDLENFFRKTERALSAERAEWLMEFFNAKEQS